MTIIPDWDGRSDSAEDDIRVCTCHPDDNPPIPCARQYAFSDCMRVAEARALDAAWLIGAPSRPRIVDTLISLAFAAAICAGLIGWLLS